MAFLLPFLPALLAAGGEAAKLIGEHKANAAESDAIQKKKKTRQALFSALLNGLGYKGALPPDLLEGIGPADLTAGADWKMLGGAGSDLGKFLTKPPSLAGVESAGPPTADIQTHLPTLDTSKIPVYSNQNSGALSSPEPDPFEFTYGAPR